MIKLSKRLNTIANLITKDDVVIDIGCDHALLDIYLESIYNKTYYASDLRESALNIAEDNIKKYKSKKVILKCGNGLEVIDNADINTAVISGMGYITIIKILSNKEKLKGINNLIISSNTNPEIVRKYVIKNGFYVYKEELVFDKNIYYTISYFKRGSKRHNKIDIEIGSFEKSEILDEYLKTEIKKNNILLGLIPKTYILKRFKIKQRIKLLNKKKESIN